MVYVLTLPHPPTQPSSPELPSCCSGGTPASRTRLGGSGCARRPFLALSQVPLSFQNILPRPGVLQEAVVPRPSWMSLPLSVLQPRGSPPTAAGWRLLPRLLNSSEELIRQALVRILNHQSGPSLELLLLPHLCLSSPDRIHSSPGLCPPTLSAWKRLLPRRPCPA